MFNAEEPLKPSLLRFVMEKAATFAALILLTSSCNQTKLECGDFSYKLVSSFSEIAGQTPYRIRVGDLNKISTIQECYTSNPLYENDDEIYFIEARYREGRTFYLIGLYGYTDTRIIAIFSAQGALEGAYVEDVRG